MTARLVARALAVGLGALALVVTAGAQPPAPARPGASDAQAPPASGLPPPTVTAVEITSPHVVPEAPVRAAIGDLVGRPRLRGAIRESLVRLWALGLFADVRVEEVAEAGGVRLRYLLARRPHVRDIEFRGDLGLDIAQVAAAAALARNGPAEPERLEGARHDVLALYEREGYLDARVVVETVADPATNGRDVRFQIAAGDQARIERIRMSGNVHLSDRFVLGALGLKEGGRYRESGLREGVTEVERRYRDRGFFEVQVKAERAPGDRRPGRIDLAVTVAEGPHTSIEFGGVGALAQSALRERLTFADTRTVDDLEIRASARQIEAAYREHGYAFVKVEGSWRREERDQFVRFEVTEGPRVTVGSVSFTGTSLPAARLRRHVETRPPGTLGGGAFRQDLLTRDAQSLRAFLRSAGFPDATVEPPAVTFSDDRTRAHVTFVVSEGPRLTVGDIGIVGTTRIGARELRELVPLRVGSAWSEAQAEEGRRLIERRYARHGYHAAEVRLDRERRDGAMNAIYRVREGTPTRIGQIVVRGLVQTREHVVRRELPFRAGDPLNPEDLVEAQRRLTALGLFERVSVEPLTPPPAPFADVTVTIEERKPWHVELGVGYTTYEGARGLLELGEDNLFGTGRSLALRGRLSERGDREELIYGEPWVFGTRWKGDANLFREKREEIGYSFERYGLGLGVSRELIPERIRGLRAAVRYEISRIDRFNVDPTLVQGEVVRGTEVVATVTPEVTLDRRDRPLDPSRGSFHLLSFRTGGVVFGGDSDFVKSRVETRWFFDWPPPTVLALSARLGFASTLLGTSALPVEERFFAGGATTVRGYRERRLGPEDERGNPIGGNALAVFNVEWRFPLWRWIGGAVFFDTGAVTPEVRDLGLDAFKSGMGAGVLVNTPVGPVRLDAGYPLDRERPQTDRNWQFYLTVGHPF